jgi:hypothetical protein
MEAVCPHLRHLILEPRRIRRVSVPVSLAELREAVTKAGSHAFLLTVTGDGRPHAVSVTPSWDGDRLAVSVGSGTAANATDRPAVTLLWPPVEDGGYSLIVDGSAGVDGGRVAVQPAKAVWHRTAVATDGGARSDCVPVFRT